MFSFLLPLVEVIKVIIASVASVIFTGFACLTLAGTAVAFALSTPVFIIFSPILVPAGIATAVLTTGLTAGGSFASTAIGLIMWLIKKKMGVSPAKNPPPASAPSTSGFMFPGLRLIGSGNKSKFKGTPKDRMLSELKGKGRKLKGKLKGRGSMSGSEGGTSGSAGGTRSGSEGGTPKDRMLSEVKGKGRKIKGKSKGRGSMSGSEGGMSGSAGGTPSGSEGGMSS